MHAARQWLRPRRYCCYTSCTGTGNQGAQCCACAETAAPSRTPTAVRAHPHARAQLWTRAHTRTLTPSHTRANTHFHAQPAHARARAHRHKRTQARLRQGPKSGVDEPGSNGLVNMECSKWRDNKNGARSRRPCRRGSHDIIAQDARDANTEGGRRSALGRCAALREGDGACAKNQQCA
jgi:hypothetical protein